MQYKGKTVDKQPACNWKAVYRDCAKYQQFIIEVREYNEEKEISRQQMAYLHAVVFPALADHVGCSELMAEIILKKKSGEQWFIQEIDGNEIIISKTMLTVEQTTKWMENIFDWMESIGCPVTPPDPNWRANRERELTHDTEIKNH